VQSDKCLGTADGSDFVRSGWSVSAVLGFSRSFPVFVFVSNLVFDFVFAFVFMLVFDFGICATVASAEIDPALVAASFLRFDGRATSDSRTVFICAGGLQNPACRLLVFIAFWTTFWSRNALLRLWWLFGAWSDGFQDLPSKVLPGGSSEVLPPGALGWRGLRDLRGGLLLDVLRGILRPFLTPWGSHFRHCE